MAEDYLEWECDKLGYIKLTSMWGGEGYGRCVQLTTDKGYCQMTFDNAREFFRDAIRLTDAMEEGLNENPPWWETIHPLESTAKSDEK